MNEDFESVDQWGIEINEKRATILMLEWNHHQVIGEHIISLYSYTAQQMLITMLTTLSISVERDGFYPLVTKKALLYLLNILESEHKSRQDLQFYIDSITQEMMLISHRWKLLNVGNSERELSVILEGL